MTKIVSLFKFRSLFDFSIETSDWKISSEAIKTTKNSWTSKNNKLSCLLYRIFVQKWRYHCQFIRQHVACFKHVLTNWSLHIQIHAKRNTKFTVHCIFFKNIFLVFILIHVNGSTTFYHLEIFVINIKIILEERLIGRTQNSLNECQGNGQFSNVLRFYIGLKARIAGNGCSASQVSRQLVYCSFDGLPRTLFPWITKNRVCKICRALLQNISSSLHTNTHIHSVECIFSLFWKIKFVFLCSTNKAL